MGAEVADGNQSLLEYTKIIATIGPATWSLEGIRALIRAGANACRVNFSHGDGATLGPIMQRVREASRLENRPVALLADVQGPKLRIGVMPKAGVLLVPGGEFTLTSQKIEGSEQSAQVEDVHLADDVEPGTRILLADGSIDLAVESVDGGDVHCRILTGGRLFSRKGINLPGRRLSVDTLTEKDRLDLEFLSGTDVDLVAISFVRTAEDLKRARQLLGRGDDVPLIAKLERPEAIENLDEILDASDGVMVARGDLGVELPLEQVPVLQKEILERASQRGRWSVVATQMLASMVSARRPSRAEASDVVNAVLDGADAVMLSEETAIGEYPEVTVTAMRTLVSAAEKYHGRTNTPVVDAEALSFPAAAAGAAIAAAARLGARAIVVLAGSGLTALHVSKWRPHMPIVALASSPGTLRRANLLRAVHPLQILKHANLEEQLVHADRFLLNSGWAEPGDVVVTVAAIPLGTGRETNTIRFHRVRSGAA